MTTHDIELPPLPRPQVPLIDADIDLMDIRRLVNWCEKIANEHARAAIEADRNRRQTEAEEVCGEAYQVVGSLLSDLGIFETDHAKKILDNLSQAKMVHKDVLPWPSFDCQCRGEPVAYHPCTSILIEGLKRLPGGSAILAEWDKARSKVDAPQPAEPCASSVSNKTACRSKNGNCDSQPADPEHATRNLQPSSALQPVATAFFTEQGEVAFTGLFDRTLKALEAVKTTRMGISSGSIDLYAAPQAAAPVKVPSDDALADALNNLEHDNYEQSYRGYKNRQADIALIRTALAAIGETGREVEK